MVLTDFLPVFIQIVLAIGMGVGILAASHIFGQRATRSKIKDSPYECGLSSEVGSSTRYSVKFYVTAMLFILFDIDVVFLIPWVLTHRELSVAGVSLLGPMLFFYLCARYGSDLRTKKRSIGVGKIIIPHSPRLVIILPQIFISRCG